MSREGNKIVVLETGGSHDEILYSQFRFLKDSGFEIHLIIRREHLQRISDPEGVNFILSLSSEKGWIDRWKNLVRIWKYLINQKINFLLINTCQGAFIRDLCFLIPRRTNTTGIAHNPQKLNRSFNQKLITRKVKKYLVLSDNILKNVEPYNPGLTIRSFYPVFYPQVSVPNKTEGFIVTVPGAVDMKRRDYYHLLEELKPKDLNNQVKIVFLGRCKSEAARKFKAEFSSIMSENHYKFFNDFIPEKEFLGLIAQSDLILPLITKELGSYDLYRDYKITGGINLAYGFEIPLLLEDSLNDNPDYKTAAFFYEKNKLVDTINHLSKNESDLKKKKSRIKKELKFKYTYQKDNYISFILRT